MGFVIKYTESVIKSDLPKINKKEKEQICKAIEKKLVELPHVYGKPLRLSLIGFRKLRVGNYRVIFEIKDKEVVVYAIGHRKNIYDIARSRSLED